MVGFPDSTLGGQAIDLLGIRTFLVESTKRNRRRSSGPWSLRAEDLAIDRDKHTVERMPVCRFFTHIGNSLYETDFNEKPQAVRRWRRFVAVSLLHRMQSSATQCLDRAGCFHGRSCCTLSCPLSTSSCIACRLLNNCLEPHLQVSVRNRPLAAEPSSICLPTITLS